MVKLRVYSSLVPRPVTQYLDPRSIWTPVVFGPPVRILRKYLDPPLKYLYQEAAMNDDAEDQQDAENHQDDAIHEEGPETATLYSAEDAKDHHQDDDVEQLETDNILDYAIEYKMKGAYPPGVTKDKKRAVRKRAQTICIEEGELYILRKKNKVCPICLRST